MLQRSGAANPKGGGPTKGRHADDNQMSEQRDAFVHPSLTSLPEADLVQRLLAHPFNRPGLLDVCSIPSDAITLTQVPLAGLPGNPRGDVDLLAWAPGRPEEAVAIEVKRFKVIVGGPGSRPNKLHEFKKGVRQASLLAKVGFFRVYLCALLVVDSRIQNAGTFSYAGMTADLQTTVTAAMAARGLDSRVGIARCEMVQPMDCPPLTVGAGGFSLVRFAEPSQQPSEITEWVMHVVQHSGA